MEIFRKYLKEDCSSDGKTQLSLKYFFEFHVVFEIFSFSSDDDRGALIGCGLKSLVIPMTRSTLAVIVLTFIACTVEVGHHPVQAGGQDSIPLQWPEKTCDHQTHRIVLLWT